MDYLYGDEMRLLFVSGDSKVKKTGLGLCSRARGTLYSGLHCLRQRLPSKGIGG